MASAYKNIYGTLDASLLFWGEISKSLEEMGYQRNEYDWCVMNNIIDDKQCTILYNVNYLKTSHVEPYVIPIVLADINLEYVKIEKIIITQGKVYKYLGMTIDYSSPG